MAEKTPRIGRLEPVGTAQPALELRYDRGSVLLSGPVRRVLSQPPPWLVEDPRVGAWRALALHYRALVRLLTRQGLTLDDGARAYSELTFPERPLPHPFPHQAEALAAWNRGKRGVVELPTGSGKTMLAVQALRAVLRGTIVLVPTLDLAAQWVRVLEEHLGQTPGMIGGGSFEPAPVTVCTYASAYRHVEHFGDRYGLVVFDECHHLAGEGYARIAEGLIAPYRLGLSATVERPDLRHHELTGLIGPIVYQQGITALAGRYLAPYRTEVVQAGLNAEEEAEYQEARGRYQAFARERRITPGSARDWQRFVFVASRDAAGREALAAFYRQKEIAFACEGKFAACADLLHRHRGQRVIIFTNDNRTAYRISERFLLPLITHQTRLAERKTLLANFREGRWPVIVTSRVLNEGVDVPSAAVAIIVSGTASVREHVQRLGRILRREDGKEAVLYELLTRFTAEEYTSRRRRQHDAYREEGTPDAPPETPGEERG